MRLLLSLPVVLLIAASAGAGEPTSCARTVGAEKAALYVRHCIQVSPATRPPCHVDNPCALIVGEIKRGCSLFRAGEAGSVKTPAFCQTYLSDGAPAK